jgi:hypothetical protein
MIKLKKPAAPKQEVPAVVASLAARLEQARAEAGAFIESKVAELKALPEGQQLPIDWLRQNLRALNGGYCNCRVALSLLEKDNQP